MKIEDFIRKKLIPMNQGVVRVIDSNGIIVSETKIRQNLTIDFVGV